MSILIQVKRYVVVKEPFLPIIIIIISHLAHQLSVVDCVADSDQIKG